MNQYVDNILHAFAQLDDDNQQLQRISTLTPELNWVDDVDIDEMLHRLAALSGGISPPILDRGLEVLIGRLARNAEESTEPPSTEARIAGIEAVYKAIVAESRGRNYLLSWLAAIRSDLSLAKFAELVNESPPTCPNSVVVAFTPLLQHRRNFDVGLLFPSLLGGIQHPSVAAAIVDLANFVAREKRVPQHPAAGSTESLIKMLGMLTEQLAMLEEGKVPEGKTPDEISRMVNETVSLIASLCDALALIGNKDAIGKLNRAGELKHRRIRAEALSALCSLGQEEAGKQLIELAAEPVIRLRVLKYAEELGLLDEIDESLQDEVARAESQLAMWLAHPSNMGLAPKSIEKFDQRRLAWPGFDNEVDCFLFLYSYELAQSRIENIGFAGPAAHAFSMNLQHLDASDIFACFAGWHCTHEEITELSIPQARLQRPGLVERMMSRLSVEAHELESLQDIEPQFMGLFMGDEVLIAAGVRNGDSGTFVVNRDLVAWFPANDENSPARHELAYCVYKGRRLLGAFNQPEVWPGTETSVS